MSVTDRYTNHKMTIFPKLH